MDKNDILQMIDEREHLAHYGVKGQKWGVRRFQNEDGSLTPEGYKHYGIDQNKSNISEAIAKVNAKTTTDYSSFNKKEIKNDSEENILANRYFKKAEKFEPQITKDVVDSVKNIGSTMYGLENRLKQPESLSRKIFSDSVNKRIDKEKAAEDISDIIRYTMISDEDKLIDDYKKLKNLLEEKGYEEQQLKNYYKRFYDNKVSHKALQSVYKDKNGVSFEIQYHTPSSQAVKELKLPLYNEARQLKTSDIDRKEEIENEMRELAKKINDPKDILSIIEYDKLKHLDDNSDFLAHYGVKGQKRGVRRWQNEDGSLTPEGYRHYGIDPNRQKANLSVSGLQMARYKKDIFNKSYSDSRSSGLNRSESIKKAKEISDKELDRVYGTRTQDFRRDPGLFKQYPIYKSEYAEERDSKSINAPKNFKILDNNLNKNSDNKTDQDRIKKEIEFKKINESAEDFYKKKAEQHDKYEAMSAIGSCLSFNESIGIEPSVRDMLNEIYGYKHEDGDQGNYSSLTFYTVDNNLEEEYEKLKKEASPFFRDLSFNSDAWTQGLNELFLSDLYNEDEIKEYASKAKEIMSKFPGIENAEKVLDDSEYWDIPWSKLEPWQVAEINKKLSLAHSDNSDFLAHWGIKGQKWGKRRFQNEDGSLTPEGRKRYGVGDGNNKTETKDYHEMSDQELSEALRRKRLENQYVNLKLGDPAKSKKEKIEFIKEAVSTTNKTIDLVDKTILESQRRDLNDEAERLREENKNKDLSKAQRSSNEEEIKYYEDAAKNINLSKDLMSQSMTSINAMVDLAGRKVIKKSKLNPEKVAEVAKDISEMSNDELQRQVNRMLMEKQYDQLMNPPKESNWVKGREVLQTIGSIIGIVGGTAGIVWTSMKIAEMIGKVAHDDMNDDVLTHYAMIGEDFLAHYGVKGQKRGVRRWQNEDGSLTPEGYRHYGIDPNTGRGENIVTSRQIERYRKDTYKDAYRKAREEGYDRKQAKDRAIADRTLESVKAYGSGRLAERNRRIDNAWARGGLIGGGVGAVRGGMAGARATEDGELTGLGMAVGGIAGGLVGSKLGGAIAKRFGNYENKHIKAVDEIDKILINAREMTRDEAEKAILKYNDKIADEYSKKYADLLDKNYMINKKSEDFKKLEEEYNYVLEAAAESFGPAYMLNLARKVSDKFDEKKIEKMREEMSGTKKK